MDTETTADDGAPACEAFNAGRRQFIKVSTTIASAPLVLTAPTGAAAEVSLILPPSPPTVPWMQDLPTEITPLRPQSQLTPEPTEHANTNLGECGRLPHQRWQELCRYPDWYEMTVKVNPAWVFHPSYPAQPVWGFDGDGNGATSPGPTFFARYGHPIVCRIHNELPWDHQGFGSPEICTHLHNLHTPSESDGFPGDYFSQSKAGPSLNAPGGFQDHFWPNICAGYDEMANSYGDAREALGTLFYHDHTFDFTGPNVYRGLAGFYLLFDDLDSGDERDATPGALRLPSHPYDYPLCFADRRFDPNGMLYYDQTDPEGTLGDKVIVNGKIEPVLRVARRKYRLRLLNGGPTRFYEFYLVNSRNAAQTFTYIGNDGNLLPAPLLNQTRVRLCVAERADIVVDFSRYPLGTELYIVNRLEQSDTRGPGNVKAPGTRVLKIIVDRHPPEADVSVVPAVLRPLRPIDPLEVAQAPVRRWVFARKGGLWTVNDQIVNLKSPRARIARGSVEVWELVNPSGGWEHPVHIHFEEGRILSKTVDGVGVAIPPHERGRKDVFCLGKTTTMRVLMRFRDFTGKYVMHCHNLAHEDHAMMVRWDIE